MLVEHYNNNKEKLLEQIKEINADIIIFGVGHLVSRLFFDDLKLEEIKKITSENWCESDYWRYELKENKLYIEIDHPASFAFKNKEVQEDYIKDIVNIVNPT